MHLLAPHRYIRLLRHRVRRGAVALRRWVRGSEVGSGLLGTLAGGAGAGRAGAAQPGDRPLAAEAAG
jgi:hypothetical protein